MEVIDLVQGIQVTHVIIPLYLAFMTVEILISKRAGIARYELKDTAVSLTTNFGSGFERVMVGSFYYFLLMWFYQYRIFEIEFTWIALAACIVLEDFAYYWIHRLSHRTRIGWASHVTHHSSQNFNFSVALRQTWTFLFTGLIVVYIPLVLLGFHPAMVFFCGGLNLAYQFLLHTEMVKRLPKWYEAVMNTPSHHRVHHGINKKYIDANYAGIFIVWDKLFGTFVAEDDNEPVRYGITKNLTTFNVLTVQFHEWIAMFKDFFKPGISASDRLGYIWRPPGWSPIQAGNQMVQREMQIEGDEQGSQAIPNEISGKRQVV